MSEEYKNKILKYSLILNELQKPIRILDSIKWGDEIEDYFIKNKFKSIPQINEEYYQKIPLSFDPDKKRDEFKSIIQSLKNDFSKDDPFGQILIRNTIQYLNVVSMLKERGNKKFSLYSKELYGSPNEILNDGSSRLNELSLMLDQILKNTDDSKLGQKVSRDISSEDVVKELRDRLMPYFEGEKIKVKLSDGIVSDASAGSDYIKIKSETFFSKRDLLIFEVHEGWVHLGTTLNGKEQTYAKWLSKGPPCSTITQEGLAVFMELINFALYPKRAQRLNDRLIVCEMVEEGANVLDVIDFYRNKGQGEKEAIASAGRVFRGVPLEGGSPFTKDISYLKGFVEIYNFLRKSTKEGKSYLVPFLFCGKVTLEDVPVLYQGYQEGIIDYPRFLPKQIKDMNGLMVWMAFSNFFNKMKLDNIPDEVTQIKKIA